jgi:hypothetical protein
MAWAKIEASGKMSISRRTEAKYMILELWDAFGCGRVPSAVEDCFFRPIEANREIKRSVPGR